MHAVAPDSVGRYVRMRDIVADAGVRAPAVHATDEGRGFALIEDFGDDLYDEVLKRSPERERELYERAWETIDTLQSNVPADAPIPRYDDELIDRELGLFPEWYADALRGKPLSGGEAEEYAEVCRLLKECLKGQRQTYVHRDFHSRNLFAVEPGPGVIDFSDAVIGPAAYDIASLLRDLYVEIGEDGETDYVVRHWEHSRAAGLGLCADPGEHYRVYEWTSLQRLTKILGLFVRLARERGKEQFLAYVPECERRAHAIALRYRELRPLALMIEERAK